MQLDHGALKPELYEMTVEINFVSLVIAPY